MFINDQVTRFNQYKLQGFVFNEPIWFQLVAVDEHWVKIKLINGDK
jgi:hypothetical protein